jgi:L-alanine-DL-glutamate epimerase-like enolase superfamily enzyme
MTSTRCQLEPVRLQLVRPFETGAGTITVREGFLVSLEQGGQVGVGEAMPLPPAGTETLAQCEQALRSGNLDDAPAARFAIETALLDLEGKRKGLSVAQLLAPEPATSIAVSCVIASRDAAEQARALKAEGFTCFKLKLPADVAAVRAAIGPDAELRLDANGRPCETFEAFRPAYIEDPSAQPTRIERMTVAADAWLSTAEGRARVLDERLADVCVLKPAVLGGLKASLDFAQQAIARGMKVVVTTTLEGVVARLAALHLAAALNNGLAHGLATARWLASDHAADPAPVIDARMSVPRAPGLGIDLKRIQEVAA